MDFLKSALVSAISKGPHFPYAFDDRVDLDQSIWSLNNGTKREDGSKCSIFSFDINANKSRLPLARNAVRKLRTIRHPGVIKVLDTVETESYIYISTERVVPLGWHIRRRDLAPETVDWGLHNVARTLAFINEEAFSVHGGIRTSSVFLSESGEWKLGGFDILSSLKDDEGILYSHGSLLPDYGRYVPSEITEKGWKVVKKNPTSAVDAWMFGLLIYEAFGGVLSQVRDSAAQTKIIPSGMQQSYRRLLNANPKSRSSVRQFLEQGLRAGGFFDTPLIRLTEDIDRMGMKSEGEREEFLNQLHEIPDEFPENFLKMKILPELLKSVEFGGGGTKVFGLVMKISAKLSEEEFDAVITPVVSRLFARPDRAIRVYLLESLPLMIDHLTSKVVNDKIFPQMISGFTDLAPVVREQTVKAVLTVISKLSDRTINGDLLKCLAKTANDEQPGIRTNTTICLGKIARSLSNNTRTKVLVAAFSRSLRDPFVHARNAALLAWGATADLFNEDDCANRIMAAICPSLVDKEKIVRDQAGKTLDIYMQRVRKYAQTMPETVLPPTSNLSGTASSAAPRIGTPGHDSPSWAGWAISSFTNKLAGAKGEIQQTVTATADMPRAAELRSVATSDSVRPTSVPLLSNGSSSLHRQALSSTSAKALARPSTVAVDVQDPYADNEAEEEEAADAWTAMENDFESINPVKPNPIDAAITAPPYPANTSPSNFDDKGEPDFAGWLDAQARTKKSSGPLPKGLGKVRPAVIGRAATTGTTRTAGSAGPTSDRAGNAPKNVVPIKPTARRAAENVEEEDEGWGDAWD